MKLRNKETGEIYELLGTKMEMGIIWLNIQFQHRESKAYCYNSLAELNEEWEDCKPVEPLIKDEKVRKAVRAWAEANNSTQIVFDGFHLASDVHGNDIEFSNCWAENINHGEWYTIEELCGEEENESQGR